MRLMITTPVAVVVDEGDIRHLRAEDETGAFGILPGHGDFVTVLSVSVLTWKDKADKEHHAAVSGGVLTVKDGNLIEIASRDAVGEDTLKELGPAVLARFKEEKEAEEVSRVSTARLHLAAIKQIERYLETGRQSLGAGGQGMPPFRTGLEEPQ